MVQNTTIVHIHRWYTESFTMLICHDTLLCSDNLHVTRSRWTPYQIRNNSWGGELGLEM